MGAGKLCPLFPHIPTAASSTTLSAADLDFMETVGLYVWTSALSVPV